MKFSKEDPRLTAYALGEIEDPQARIEIEMALAADPELQAEVDAIRSMGDWIGEGFAREAEPELSEFDKVRMEHAAVGGADAVPVSWVRVHWRSLAGLAASIVFLALLLQPRVGTMKRVSHEVDGLRQDDLAEVASVNRSVYRTSEALMLDEAVAAYGAAPQVKVSNMGVVPVQASAPLGVGAGSRQRSQMALSDAFYSGDAAYAAKPAVNAASTHVSALPESCEAFNTEAYDPIESTGFRSPLVAPLSTFSIDVDTASYANVRRFLDQGQLPPADAVRIEELVNYFKYEDAAPAESLSEGGAPFAVHLEQMAAPWKSKHRLLRIALKGYEMPWDERPASNLVFLIDVSGSMDHANKLPLLKDTLQMLTRRLDGRDRVAVVVYAGASGLVLPSTTANNTATIDHALAQLKAGGSTNGGAGVELAYQVAREHFIKDGNNRVILCTDGDFNVGQTNRGDLARIAAEQAEQGVSLTVLGFGMGNYKDNMLEELSNKGKGSYAYVDSEAEARKVFLQDLASNIFKIAKDVKIQVEFNPASVSAYRLIGYENRRLKAEDFNDDRKAAGDIGPGHSLVALYEIVPAGIELELPGVDALRYQQPGQSTGVSDELATVKLRYKQPDADVSKLIERTVTSDAVVASAEASEDLQFGAAVAAFGMRLRQHEAVATFSYEEIESLAAGALGGDSGGHRSEFLGLVRMAGRLADADTVE